MRTRAKKKQRVWNSTHKNRGFYDDTSIQERNDREEPGAEYVPLPL